VELDGLGPKGLTHAESRFAKRRQHQVRNDLLKIHDAPFFRRRVENCEAALQVARENSVGDIGEGGRGYESLDGIALGLPVHARREEDAEKSVRRRRGEAGWWSEDASGRGTTGEWERDDAVFGVVGGRKGGSHTLFL
jgi:hypothetical protein